jgi:hypothetical protein
MNLLKIKNICYSETFLMRKSVFFIGFVVLVLIFRLLDTAAPLETFRCASLWKRFALDLTSTLSITKRL